MPDVDDTCEIWDRREGLRIYATNACACEASLPKRESEILGHMGSRAGPVETEILRFA